MTEKRDGKVAPGPNYITVGRNLAMELVRVTEVSFQQKLQLLLGPQCLRIA